MQYASLLDPPNDPAHFVCRPCHIQSPNFKGSHTYQKLKLHHQLLLSLPEANDAVSGCRVKHLILQNIELKIASQAVLLKISTLKV